MILRDRGARMRSKLPSPPAKCVSKDSPDLRGGALGLASITFVHSSLRKGAERRRASRSGNTACVGPFAVHHHPREHRTFVGSGMDSRPRRVHVYRILARAHAAWRLHDAYHLSSAEAIIAHMAPDETASDSSGWRCALPTAFCCAAMGSRREGVGERETGWRWEKGRGESAMRSRARGTHAPPACLLPPSSSP